MPDAYITLDQCRQGMAYKLQSRNLAVGVYDGNEGFTGIREKFGRRYLFTEYHSDQGEPFGTAYPLEELELCPEPLSGLSEALFAWLDNLEQLSGLARPRVPDRRCYPQK
jgi:hypothetical protein